MEVPSSSTSLPESACGCGVLSRAGCVLQTMCSYLSTSSAWPVLLGHRELIMLAADMVLVTARKGRVRAYQHIICVRLLQDQYHIFDDLAVSALAVSVLAANAMKVPLAALQAPAA